MRLFKLFFPLLLACSGFVAAQQTLSKAPSARAGKRQTAKPKRPVLLHQQSKTGPIKQGVPSENGDEADNEARNDWFLYPRQFPFGKIPAGARRRAWDAARPQAGLNTPQDESPRHWRNIGPVGVNSFFPNNWGKTSGRLNAIAVAPNDPNLLLLGSGTGGIWRSTDGGVNFAPVSDNASETNVGSIAFAPSQPAVVYASMGDAFNGYLGSGVLKSTDAGATWARVSNAATLPEGSFNFKILVDPQDPNRVYLSQTSFNPRDGNAVIVGGIFISTDGGVNWTKTFDGQCRDLAINPADPNILYLAARRFQVAGSATTGVYRSTNRGQTWSLLLASPLATPSDTRLAVTPADPQRIYFYTGLTTGSLQVLVSADGGANWTNRGANGIDPGQFAYNSYIVADPANPNTLYVGSRDVYKSVDGGVSWTNITRSFNGANFGYTPTQSNAHPDQHAFAFAPNDPNTIYVGNDGGIYKSTNAGAGFTSLNATLSLSQAVGFTLHPTDNSISYMGTQDNGSQRRLSGTDWREFSTGDGGNNVVPAISASKVFSTYVYGSVSRFGNNGQTFEGQVGTEATFGESATTPRIAFYPPFVGNGVDDTIYFGTYRLFVSANLGASWTAPAGVTDLTTGGTDVLNAIAVAKSNINVIYTGSRSGRAMRSNDGGVNWTNITTGLPARTITAIKVSPTNPATAWLAVSGFGSGHIFKTSDSGATWVNISGDLPNIPVTAILPDPLDSATLYLGTDLGVFRSPAGGNTWTHFNFGIPPVPVTQLVANTKNRIMAATYGRGIYEAINPIDDARTFVRNHYVDFLNREPDVAGSDYWTGQLTQCGSDEACLHQRRISVSAAFFVELEFQATGAYVYRMYRAAYGARPTYAQFSPDRAQVVGGPDLNLNKLAFATAFTLRPEFIARYPLSQTGEQFVDAVLLTIQQNSGVNLQSERAALISNFNSGGRALAMRNVADLEALAQAEYNRAFVLMQYFGYLTRDPDQGGYDFWLNILNQQPSNFRGMVCAFLTSTEYQRRFGIVATRSNADCG